MAAPMKILNLANFARKCSLKWRYVQRIGSNCNRMRRVVTAAPFGVLIAATPVVAKSEKDDEMQLALSNKRLIQNAALATVDASSAMLNQAVMALILVEDEYTKVAKELTATIDYSLQNLDNEFARMKAWNKINDFRDTLSDLKIKREHYEQIVEHAEKLLNTAAEAAFVSGSEYASTVAGEHLYSAQVKKEIQRRETERAERELQAMEVKSIKMTSKHAEKQTKQRG
ncbi:diablo homolog, mitochondrial-like isoform X2 [Tubulanus polymorphus]|uniref:diablo homolog, mitochondrial-like isoform X2 n=1 Tax=Tubulanus polymorphus TaxID=672921 RepID=UPI003DA5C02F